MAILSVVLTSYNYARYLPAALLALLAQARPPDELIVIDDCSGDDSVAIINSLLHRFAEPLLVQNPDNLGTIANLNRGLELARGEVVYFAAADDVTEPGLFEPGAALFSARSNIIDTEGRIETTLATAIPLRHPGYIAPEEVARMLMQDDNWLTGNTTLYRRAPLVAAGGFAPELGSFCDGYVSRLLAARYGACFSPEVLGAWRRHEGGFAWSQTADLARARQLAAVVERRMEADGAAFPPGYSRRWAGRHLFGAQRFALVRTRVEAGSRGVAARLRARIYEVAMTLVLFIAYRPWDAVAVARRWVAVWRHRARNRR
jgi:glycosyltransferase involved in cell wall biosynthesis